MAQTIFEAAGGRDAFERLAEAWHERVVSDPVVGHAFEHGFRADHTTRLAAYLAEALGGPPEYTETMGTETGVRRLHSGNGDHAEMDRRAVAAFAAAVEDANLPADSRLRTTLVDYFSWATTELAAYPESPDAVPDGMPMVHWDWDGPVA